MEKLDHILSQCLSTDDEVVEIVEQVKDGLSKLQNINLISPRSKRENIWLEEVKELCSYTESVGCNFILVKERRSKMGWLKTVFYLSADYASENKFKKQMKYIRTRIGDAVHSCLTYGVGGQLDMGVGFKKTTPIPDLSLESLINKLIQLLIIYALISFFHLQLVCFWLAIIFPFLIYDGVQGRTTKSISKSNLKKIKKVNQWIIRWTLRFLFYPVIYIPSLLLFQFHPVLATFLFILSY
jgi:hypothetical protein